MYDGWDRKPPYDKLGQFKSVATEGKGGVERGGIRLIEQSVTTVETKRGERTYLHSAQKGRRGKHSGEMEAHLTAVMASNPAAGGRG